MPKQAKFDHAEIKEKSQCERSHDHLQMQWTHRRLSVEKSDGGSEKLSALEPNHPGYFP